MEGSSTTAVIKNSSEPSEKPKVNMTVEKIGAILLGFAVITIVLFIAKDNLFHQKTNQNTKNLSLNAVIRTACATTLYPSLCLSTLSLSSAEVTNLHHLLEVSINHTTNLVSTSRTEIIHFFDSQELNLQESNALSDCLDMLDQTIYELDLATDDLRASPRLLPQSYSNLKTLLSAAMTNENTCIDGFSDLEKFELAFNSQKDYRIYLEMKLRPIIHMISNSLAIVNHMENINQEIHDQKLINHQEKPSTRGSKLEYPPWMSRRDRKLMGRRNYRSRPNVVVAWDGSGNYRTIRDALKMAPNMSMGRFVIRIKAGIYKENVDVPRNKMNIMLIGDGINSTLISGSRSLLDGFSTFTSATLTVIGDRFLARDLTIENTATPEKFQAVAARVTSNSAFYRCNFTSNQDTLYAHSLQQFYRDCVIQGTIDFIFGNAAAIFQNCHIFARKPILGQSNMITAQSREDPNQNTGFSLQNCTIQAASDFTLIDRRRTFTFLGRPWRNFSRTVIMKSYLGDLIHPQGWSEWDEYTNSDTVEYIEYKNFGPGSDIKNRVRWKGYKRNCTEDLVKKYTVRAFLHSPDNWLETTRFSLFHGF